MRLVMIADLRGWCYDRTASSIRRYHGTEHVWDVVYALQIVDGTPSFRMSPAESHAAIGKADLVRVGGWSLFEDMIAAKMLPPHLCYAVGIASFADLDQVLANKLPHGYNVLALIPYDQRMVAPLERLGVPVVYSPDNVDDRAFFPAARWDNVLPKLTPASELCAGWAGSLKAFGNAVRHVDWIEQACASSGFSFVRQDRDRDGFLDEEHMRRWLDGLDLYVCANEEATCTPVTALEAIACGVPVLTTKCGELWREIGRVDARLVLDQPDPMLLSMAMVELSCLGRDGLAELGSRLRLEAGPKIFWSSTGEAKRVTEELARLVEGHIAGRPDFRDELTVFVISVGGSTFARCLAALDAQDCRFRVKLIRNVAPMSVAFQTMIDQCETPYYVQVDEDMILRPHGVRFLRDAIVKAENAALVAYPIFDEHLERAIFGVKAYRRSIMQQFPYRDVQSCEVDQLKRIEEAGYDVVVEWGSPWAEHHGLLNRSDQALLAEHGTGYGPREAFERYRDLVQKYRRIKSADWVAAWPKRFLERWRENGSDVDLYAALGAISGLVSDPAVDPGEKDFREYATMPDYGELAAHMVHGPQHLDIYTTGKCNLACSFCRRQLAGYNEAPDIQPELIERVLDEFPTIRAACVAGFGEPLMHPGLSSIMETLRQRSIPYGLITNGVLVEQLPELPYEEALYVNVSLNRARLEAGKSAVRYLLERGVQTVISFVVDSGSYGLIPDYLRLAEELSVSKRVPDVVVVNVLPHHDVNDPEMNERFWRAVLTDETQGYAEQHARDLELAHSLGLRVLAWPTPISRNYCPRLCRSPMTAIGVDGLGLVGGCQRVTPPETSLADPGYGWDETWMGRYFVELRRQLGGSSRLRLECSMCFGNWQRG